jgi:hypothetical protein
VQLGVTGGRREYVVINVAEHVPRVDQHISIGRPLLYVHHIPHGHASRLHDARIDAELLSCLPHNGTQHHGILREVGL